MSCSSGYQGGDIQSVYYDSVASDNAQCKIYSACFQTSEL